MRSILFILALVLVFPVITSGLAAKNKEKVIIRTGLGDIYVCLDLKRAPVTSLNFLRYVDAGLFEHACFYRVVRMDNQPDNPVRIEVIQGGRYENEDNGFPPIAHETTEMTGLRHKNGVISMARSAPGTATSEFFICVGDQPELDFNGNRNPDRQGFAAFGKTVRGMKVIKRIHSIQSDTQYLPEPLPIMEITRADR